MPIPVGLSTQQDITSCTRRIPRTRFCYFVEVDVGDKYHSTDDKLYEVRRWTGQQRPLLALWKTKMPEIDEIFVIETMQGLKRKNG